MRIGLGYDVHKFGENRKLIIGGIDIPHSKGLLGHSDADVLTHAIMDSILGAMALGDIGKHFPDTDDKYKDISSLKLLKQVYETMNRLNYQVNNIDSTIVAQTPKMSPYIEDMRKKLSKILNTDIDNINIKATTTEKLGFVGKEEGIAAYSICMLKKKN